MWSPNQAWLFPPSPQDWLPEKHLVYFLLEASTVIDLSPIVSKYDSDQGGQPAFHPWPATISPADDAGAAVVRLLQWRISSRRIAAACETDIAFRVIVSDDIPDFLTISEFRRRHLDEFGHLSGEVLRLCQKAGLLKVGRLALDGTKVKTNASRHKAMSYDRMTTEEKRLEEEIAELLKQAQKTDDNEDQQFGSGRRGDELPDELARRDQRLQKIREAKAALEQEARDKAATEAAAREAAGKGLPQIDPADAVPADKAQRNFTDPESKIMKTSHKGWDQCGNAQAVANADQIIVSADVSNAANDVRQVKPMVEQTVDNITTAGVVDDITAFTFDAGYFSEDNVDFLEDTDRITEAYIATGRLKHHERVAPAPQGRPPKDLTTKEKMARKLRTKKGKAEYARRKAIIEPPCYKAKGAARSNTVEDFASFCFEVWTT